MSYMVVAPTGPKARPGVVSVAVTLMYVATVLTLVYAGLAVATVYLVDNPTDLFGDGQTDAQVTGTVMTAVVVVMAALYLAIAGGMFTLAILVGKGKHAARIVTWVLGGLIILCCGCGLLGNAFSSITIDTLNSTDANALRQARDAPPTWLTVADVGVSGLIVVALILVMILLALPAANTYFHKEQQVWVPPTWPGAPGGYPPPVAGYPGPAQYPQQAPESGHPGYPAATGYPTPPGYPAGPGYPMPPAPPAGPADPPPADNPPAGPKDFNLPQ